MLFCDLHTTTFWLDTDSGLGRATPPRRAPSPGMGGGRHMPSPSGPGSLPPGLVSKRRAFDDGSSDISSTPNSMMEYSGLYNFFDGQNFKFLFFSLFWSESVEAKLA